MVQPHLSYNILAWGNANQSNLKHIIKLQKRDVTLIHAVYSNATNIKTARFL